MKKLLLIGVLFGLCSCYTTQEHTHFFLYLKDSRTNLCFASYDLGHETGVLTNVPCTPDVEAAIQSDKSLANSVR